MSKPTPIRHPSLSSSGARKALDHLTTPIYGNVFDTIDSLGAIYDGLAAVRETEDPTKTREYNALEYKRYFESAYKRARTVATERAEALANYRATIVAEAEAKAGLNTLPRSAETIWTALRGMDQKDRDAAVLEALEAGDRVVMSAIANAPSSLLTGKFTVPVDTTIGLYMDKVSPDLRPELEHIDTAASFLDLAADAFSKSAQKMRDLSAEDRGLEGSAAAKHAEARLQAAIGSN